MGRIRLSKLELEQYGHIRPYCFELFGKASQKGRNSNTFRVRRQPYMSRRNIKIHEGVHNAKTSTKTCSPDFVKTKKIWVRKGDKSYSTSLEKYERGIVTVDTPFLTVLKTWMSPLEHSIKNRDNLRVLNCSEPKTNRTGLVLPGRSGMSTVTFEDSGTSRVIGKGSISVAGLPKLENALLVDGLKENLLSISQMCDSHPEVLFSRNKSEILDKRGNIVMHGVCTSDNCYGIVTTNDLTCHSAIISNIDLWHQKLGHMNFKYLTKIANKELVRGVPKLGKNLNHVYGPCQFGKQARAPYKKVNSFITKRPLELVHMDLMRSTRTESIGVIDDTSSPTSAINEEENGESPILDTEPQSRREAEVQAQEGETAPISQLEHGIEALMPNGFNLLLRVSTNQQHEASFMLKVLVAKAIFPIRGLFTLDLIGAAQYIHALGRPFISSVAVWCHSTLVDGSATLMAGTLALLAGRGPLLAGRWPVATPHGRQATGALPNIGLSYIALCEIRFRTVTRSPNCSSRNPIRALSKRGAHGESSGGLHYASRKVHLERNVHPSAFESIPIRSLNKALVIDDEAFWQFLGLPEVQNCHFPFITVDTPFLTVLNTWTSPFEHSVIILVCVRLEFPEVSATRLASGSLNSTILCLVLHQTLVFLLRRVGNGLLAIPTPHRPWLEATSHWFVAIGQMFGRPALFVVDRPSFLVK
ncbi:hypothetical protein HYC85_028589 [Camellia sinensis]|uniref:GAG-pre-integrase domain-containing protein n=1 Tax=Camellia sinensis TaxID=4442 RepID=A0A7J7FXS4_CAMSI|nr:hypothetical protein HYC85_028589 [Camellia sinensis]